MRNPFAIAANAKGRRKMWERLMAINRRYGLTSNKMDKALSVFGQVLHKYDCKATFPVTAVVVKRHGPLIKKYQEQGVEFAVHGYVHVDHTQLSPEEQLAHFTQARRIFDAEGIRFSGFRCPYLRWSEGTLSALSQLGFTYDSSQALFWDVAHNSATDAYKRVLAFYGAQPASEYPALPSLEGKLVRIPYSLPDDEAIDGRVVLDSPDRAAELWMAVLQQTYDLGELFTVGLHPERISLCQTPLSSVLTAARDFSPPTWIARLDEIATWWRARTDTTVEVIKVAEGQYKVTVTGPPGVVVLVSKVNLDVSTQPWWGKFELVKNLTFTAWADRRPVVGVPPDNSAQLIVFLRQQGYIVETTSNPQDYSIYLDHTHLDSYRGRDLLVKLEAEDVPLLRLGRWPDGARSALAVTGDIDALTLWDYGLRFWGK